MNFYSYKPADTLFFRGAEPMNMGENHTVTANFPPPSKTITGALRTTILIQNGISIHEYYKNKVDETIMSVIGPAGEPAAFSIVGPLFNLGNAVFIPAPYSWFTDKKNNNKSQVRVYRSHRIDSILVKTASIKMYWAKGEDRELETLGGKWVSTADLFSKNESLPIKETSDFFSDEPRTGIALETNRHVRQSHLYSFTHARLKKDVSILFGVDKNLPISDEGLLKLGAEQRFGRYRKEAKIGVDYGESGLFLSLSIVEGSSISNDAVVATGKIEYLGGWDIKKNFHKPMRGYFPAGSVFNKKLDNNFIEL